MTTIFISHSRKDKELVLATKRMLVNMGHTPIIEELIPDEKQKIIPYEEIRSNVEKSEFLFLFLTDSVVATPFTQNWVIYEVGLASASSKKVFVFERMGTPVEFPIPYLTDYALFNPNKTGDILALQSLTKDLGKLRRDLLTAGGGAIIGSMFGPAGIVIGGVLGYLAGPKQTKSPMVKCNHCKVAFNYHSVHRAFNCPSCRQDIDMGQ